MTLEPKTTRRKRKTNNEVVEILEKNNVVYFKATKKLTEIEHNQLSAKIRNEMKETGVQIVLVPFSCDVDVEGESLNA